MDGHMKKEDNELYLQCSCMSHALFIERDELSSELPMRLWNISIWLRGYQSPCRDWRFIFRNIWYTIKHGRPYGDEVLLDQHQMLKLKEYIEKQLVEKSS
jgi:hypothetical protein